MTLALGTAAVVLVVLLWELVRPSVARQLSAASAAWSERRRRAGLSGSYDPGRELRAEQRARELLRSCLPPEDWEMYRDLGFLRVRGPGAHAQAGPGSALAYAYLIYPHKPIVAYLPDTDELLSEYCVAFPDETKPYGSARLPDSDDVLAKWIALTADEHELIGESNMHLPGRQIDPEQVRRDLRRLERWELGRAASSTHATDRVRPA